MTVVSEKTKLESTPDSIGTPSPVGSPRLSVRVVLEAMRPRQWIKNLLLFAGGLFTGKVFHLGPLLIMAAGFACFCALSSTIYLLNDIADREQDRLHPRKRLRPIASGQLSIGAAQAIAMTIGAAGIGFSFLLGRAFGAVALGYLLLNLVYVRWLKHEVILDVFCIASGFLMRALAGAVVVDVLISQWLLVCTSLLALVIGFGKRRQELTTLAAASSHRQVLSSYSGVFLDQLMSVVVSATLVSYLFYCFQSDTAVAHHWIPATIPFVFYGMFRYLYLLHQRGMGGAPEDLLFKDRPILLAVVGWCLAAAIAMALH